MRCLVAVDDSVIRDAVSTAVGAFPEMEVDAVGVEDGRILLRRRRYDMAFSTLGSRSEETEPFWEELQKLSSPIELVGLTSASGLSVHRADKSKRQLFALLGLPVDAVQIFSTLRRLIDRIKKSAPSRTAARRG